MNKSWIRGIAIALAIALSALAAKPAHAGEGDETLVGFLIGSSTGLIFGGAITIFYRNPDADRNITTILVTGTLIGAAAGTAWGMSLPDDAFEKDPVASLDLRNGAQFRLSPPRAAVIPMYEGDRLRWGGHTSVLGVKF